MSDCVIEFVDTGSGGRTFSMATVTGHCGVRVGVASSPGAKQVNVDVVVGLLSFSNIPLTPVPGLFSVQLLVLLVGFAPFSPRGEQAPSTMVLVGAITAALDVSLFVPLTTRGFTAVSVAEFVVAVDGFTFEGALSAGDGDELLPEALEEPRCVPGKEDPGPRMVAS